MDRETRRKIDRMSSEVMDIVLDAAARRLTQSIEFIYEDEIKPLREALGVARRDLINAGFVLADNEISRIDAVLNRNQRGGE